MSTTLLFSPDKVRKFFDILGRLGREQSGTYKGYYKIGGSVPCQKEVFVNRTLNRYLRGKHLIWYRKSLTSGIYYNCYATIGRIEFILGWGNEIKVYFSDYSRPADLLSSIKLRPNEVFDLEGQWCDNDDLHNAYKDRWGGLFINRYNRYKYK